MKAAHRGRKRKTGSKVCQFCGIPFFRNAKNSRSWNRRKFCSQACFAIDQGFKQRGRATPSGDKSHNWKGDTAKYQAIHFWVRKEKGQAKRHKCVDCSDRADDWSNVDGKYRRVLEDYEPRCRKCHHKKDDTANRAWVTKYKKYSYG